MHERLEKARRRLRDQRRVTELRARLESLLQGQGTRRELAAWLEALPDEAPGGPFPGLGSLLHDSLLNIEARDESGAYWLREVDLRSHLRFIVEGHPFWTGHHGFAGSVLVVLPPGIHALAARLGAAPLRGWQSHVGRVVEILICAPVTDRRFVARAEVEQAEPHVKIYAHQDQIHSHDDEPYRDALIDLFELLAIDERDVVAVHPNVESEVEKLPRWALWREDDHNNRFEIDRFRSFAKATAEEETLEARGHRQSYWVEEV